MSPIVETAVAIAALVGAGSILHSGSVGLIGRWGGDRAVLAITAENARLTLDCGAGAFSTPTALDRHGGFSAEGTLDLYQPGPSRADEGVGAKAVFRGRLEGDRLTLDILGGAAPTRRHYVLTRNSRVKLVRCL